MTGGENYEEISITHCFYGDCNDLLCTESRV